MLFHKCLRLLRLALYTVSTFRVNNDAAIIAHICYISLLRCNYYHKYLVCEEEDFCERYILFQGDWELLSEERLVILLKVTRTWETKPAPKYTFFFINNQKFKQSPRKISNLLNNFYTICRGEQGTKTKQTTAKTG